MAHTMIYVYAIHVLQATLVLDEIMLLLSTFLALLLLLLTCYMFAQVNLVFFCGESLATGCASRGELMREPVF